MGYDGPADTEDLQLSAAMSDTEYQDENDEEDEDDDIQTQPEADDTEVTDGTEIQQKDDETDNEMAQIEKPHHEYINKEIDFEQQFAQSNAVADGKES